MSGNRARALYWSLIILVVSVVVLVGTESTDDATALPGHIMSVSLHPPELDCKVNPEQLGAVTFGGNVTIEKQQGVEKVEVTLEAGCDKGWPVVVSPQTIAFINPGTVRFQATVIVPAATPVSSGTVTVHAHASSPIWEDDQYAEARVNVVQYVKMVLWVTRENYEASPGETVVGKLYVNNSGNGDDTFTIMLEQEARGTFDVRFKEQQITVPPGFYAEFTFSIHIDEDFQVGLESELITVILKVRSQAADAMGVLYVKTYPVYVHFTGLQDKLYENWPTYVALGVTAALIIVPTVYLVRRRRRKRDEAAMLVEETE